MKYQYHIGDDVRRHTHVARASQVSAVVRIALSSSGHGTAVEALQGVAEAIEDRWRSGALEDAMLAAGQKFHRVVPVFEWFTQTDPASRADCAHRGASVDSAPQHNSVSPTSHAAIESVDDINGQHEETSAGDSTSADSTKAPEHETGGSVGQSQHLGVTNVNSLMLGVPWYKAEHRNGPSGHTP
eukprot:3153004-Pyramimonas_sp.AAC.2